MNIAPRLKGSELTYCQGLRGIASLLVVTRYVVPKVGPSLATGLGDSNINIRTVLGLIHPILNLNPLTAICLDRLPLPSLAQLRTAPIWAPLFTYLYFVYQPKERHGFPFSSS